jgi:hypothetical protein
MTDAANTMTRRTLFIGAAASLICAPAIVRAASLMPVRGLPLQLITPKRRILNTMGDWYQFCFYNNLDSVAEGHQIIARTRALGWLEP